MSPNPIMILKALIPVRKGSQRVRGKNVRPFCGSSLLEIKIEQLKRIEAIDEICVNSDCDSMLSIARDLGATPIKRQDHFASNEVPMNEVWRHLAENMDCTDVLYTNVTNPLILDATYTSMINEYKRIKLERSYDSITSVHTVQEYLWHKNKSVNYDSSSHPRSQDLPNYYGLNFAISIIPRSLMIKRKNIVGNEFFPFYLDKIQSIDIDDEMDFKIAQSLYGELYDV
jgi:CMP-N-acetylneuraminic acid synthetase